MTTFVEAYDGESSEDDNEVVIVPFEKPVPPLISLAESDNDDEDDSTCSENNSPPSSPKPKKRRLDAIVIGNVSGQFLSPESPEWPESPPLNTTLSSKPPSMASTSQRRAVKSTGKNNRNPDEEDEDWDLPIGTIGKIWTSPIFNASPLHSDLSDPDPASAKESITVKEHDQLREESSNSTPSTARKSKKSATKQSKEEFIRCAASMGLPAMAPKYQEKLPSKQPPEVEILNLAHTNTRSLIVNPVDWEDVDDYREEEERDCIIIDDDEEEMTEFTTPKLTQPEEEIGNVQPSSEMDLSVEPEPELTQITESPTAPTPTRTELDQHVFPPVWTREMQHFYGDERPNFSKSRIHFNQSDDDRLWVTVEDGQRKRKKSWSVQCNNCQQRGHRIRDCPEKIKGIICWMCGKNGHHHVERCPKRMCLNCGAPTKAFQYPCRNCDPPNHRMRDSILVGRCAVCDVEGHLDSRCPDHWRRFHSTTINKVDQRNMDSVVSNSWKIQNRNSGKSVYRRKNQSSCANCGMKGHNYFQCKGNRPNTSCFINTPYIVHELHEPELDEIEEMCNNKFKKVNSGEGATGSEQKSPERPPNFNPKTERIISLGKADHELLLQAYERKVPAALLFFSSHLQNIVNTTPREETVDIHLNGSQESNVHNATRNMFRLLAKLKMERGNIERASLEVPKTTGRSRFLFDENGKLVEISSSSVEVPVVTIESEQLPNPLFKDKPKEPTNQRSKQADKHESDAETTDEEFREHEDDDDNDNCTPKSEVNMPTPTSSISAQLPVLRVDEVETVEEVKEKDCDNRLHQHPQHQHPQHQQEERNRYHPYASLAPLYLSGAERKGINRATRKERSINPEHNRFNYQNRRNWKQDNRSRNTAHLAAEANFNKKIGTGTKDQEKPRARAPRYFD